MRSLGNGKAMIHLTIERESLRYIENMFFNMIAGRFDEYNFSNATIYDLNKYNPLNTTLYDSVQ